MGQSTSPLSPPAEWAALITRREWATITAVLDDENLADLLQIVRDTSPAVRRLVIANLKRATDTKPPTGRRRLLWHALALSHYELVVRAAEQRARDDLGLSEQPPAPVIPLLPRQDQQQASSPRFR